MSNILIVGSGISGLSIAKMLSAEHNVLVAEKEDTIGGLIKCVTVNGNLFHKVGGHVFNSRNQNVLDWFWGHFNKDTEFLKARRNAKILMNDTLIGYPLENYLYQLPNHLITPIVNELLTTEKREVEDYDNFKDFLIGTFGNTLYELYFGPYNTKIWNTDISKVPLEWLEGKLPMPRIQDIIVSNIIKKEESSMVHAFFYYPKINGSQFIINRLAEQQNIKTAHPITHITINDDNQQLIINNDVSVNAVVYTGDVRKLSSIIDINDAELKTALDQVVNLPSNGTSNVLCETDENEISWLYLPETKFKAHRIIYTGNFSDTNNSGTSRKTCVVEFSGKQDHELMINELRLLPGNLKPIAFNYEPDSYIIQLTDTHNKIKRLKSLLSRYNIYLLGRFAEWEYYNMDKCIESAMNLSLELSSNLK